MDTNRPSLTGATWKLAAADPDRVAMLQDSLDIGPRLARCLAVRGVTGAEAARRLLDPGFHALHDPRDMAGMDRAVERLRAAIRDGERIRVVTDYDVDGTTSSLILQATLERLGCRALGYHIPDRMDEGYGFSSRAAERAAEDGVGLLLTADIGVRDHAAVSRARELGVDVIVCDHHLPGGASVPEAATAVLCPPQPACDYPNPELAACGIALKLSQALLEGDPARDRLLHSMLKLAAIGTVADVVDLFTPENRAIVALGLAELNRGPHAPGLAALLQVSGLVGTRIGARDLGFRVGPRINAAGRIAQARLVVELLRTREPARARELARDLDRLNTERRGIQQRLLRIALQELPEPPPPFVLVAGPEDQGWHRGVVGIVAARLRDAAWRPAAVVSIQGDRAVGSVRSTPEVHAVRALDAVSDLLERYGGHAAAAGFSLPASRLDELRDRLCQATLELCGGEPAPRHHEADLLVEARELDRALLESLARLEPHGKGNHVPLLWVRPAVPRAPEVLKQAHLKAVFPGRAEPVELLWWRAAAHLQAFASGGPIELLGRLSLHRWRDRERLQLTVADARIAA